MHLKFQFLIYKVVALIFILPGVIFAYDNLDSGDVNKILVAIDAGHSKRKWGATSSRGVGEYWFNHAVAKILHDQLKKAMIDVVMINDQGDEISLYQRVSEIKHSKANLLVSIHHDSVQPKYLNKWKYEGKDHNYSDIFSGFSIFISKKNTHYSDSLNISRIIGENFKKIGLVPTLHHSELIDGESKELVSKILGIYNANFAVISQSNIPSVLVECGIILNRHDELELGNLEYQTKIAEALSNSIVSYFENY